MKNFNSLAAAEQQVLADNAEILAKQTAEAKKEFVAFFKEVLLKDGWYNETTLILGMACALAKQCAEAGQDFTTILERANSIVSLSKEMGKGK